MDSLTGWYDPVDGRGVGEISEREEQMSKTGRNDPCPCGSGLKYKKCCLARLDKEQLVESNVIRMLDAEQGLIDPLASHAQAHYGPDPTKQAWEDFTLSSGLEMDPEEVPEVGQIFSQWYLYDWKGRAGLVNDKGAQIPDLTIAQHYLQVKGYRLNATERRFIETVGRSHFSFLQVQSHKVGHYISVIDLLCGTSHVIHDVDEFPLISAGTILYGRIVTLADESILFGIGPLFIPGEMIDEVLDLRESLIELAHAEARESGAFAPFQNPFLDPEFVKKHEPKLRRLYLEVREEVLEVAFSEEFNEDGEPLEHIRLIYTLKCSPGEAFDALCSLAGVAPDELLRKAATFDGEELVSAKFPWRRGADVGSATEQSERLAEILIFGVNLSVEVNSGRRADAADMEIQARLGDMALLEDRVLISDSDWLEDEQGFGNEMPALTHDPELEDGPLPELDGQSPREARQSVSGRAKLSALLDEMRQLYSDRPDALRDIDTLQSKLDI